MKLSGLKIISLIVVIAAFIIGFWAYPLMPEQVASHWNLTGEPDGYMGRFWGTWLFPLMIAFLYLLFLVVPRIDPKFQNIEKFKKYFDGFILVFTIFLTILYSLTIAWNLGYLIPFNVVLPVLMGGLFFYIGVLLDHAEPNWTIGIRTPWTLTNDAVWTKTHKLGGQLFKLAGIISMISALWPTGSFFISIGSVMTVGVILLGYSYYEYRRQIK